MTEYIELPEIFPLNDITVRDEEHLFEVFQGDDGPLPKTEYTLDKAPIDEINSVTGTVNGGAGYEFEKGVDYELSADAEKILWLNGDRPDAGTRFAVTYRTESIISRYVDSGDEEFEEAEEKIIDATQGKFVREAEGPELDEIGKLFGDVIGKRRGRNDTQYSIYLQSVVQSFVSRGTKTGIKLAVSAATNVPVADITINEDFERNEYEVIVIPDTPVQVSLLETIADIADPSGIGQVRTRFPVFDDMGVDDRAKSTFSDASTTDEISIDDTNANFRRANIEDMAADDAATLRPKSAILTDDMASADTATVPPKDAVLTDSISVDDVAATSTTNTAWDIGSWDSMNWTIEHN